MNSYNIVIKAADATQHQFGISASTWQNAIDAAKGRVNLATGPATDFNLLIVQWTGTIDIIAT